MPYYRTTADDKASRLHATLVNANRYRGSKNPAITDWAEILQVEMNGSLSAKFELMSLGSELIRQALEVRQEIITLKGDESPLYLKYFDQVEKCLENWSLISGIRMNGFMAPLLDTGLYSLEMCANVLCFSDRIGDTVDSKKYSDSIAACYQLIQSIKDSEDLSDEDREWLLHSLDQVLSRLRHYDVTGVEGIIEVQENFVGSLVVNPDRLMRIKSNKFTWAYVEKIVSILADIATIGATVLAINSPQPSPTQPTATQIQVTVQQISDQPKELPPGTTTTNDQHPNP